MHVHTYVYTLLHAIASPHHELFQFGVLPIGTGGVGLINARQDLTHGRLWGVWSVGVVRSEERKVGGSVGVGAGRKLSDLVIRSGGEGGWVSRESNSWCGQI